MFQEKSLESNPKMDVLDKDIIEDVKNVNIESTKIDVQVMKDVLKSKNLIKEE